MTENIIQLAKNGSNQILVEFNAIDLFVIRVIYKCVRTYFVYPYLFVNETLCK
jgi:hypothetical protein